MKKPYRCILTILQIFKNFLKTILNSLRSSNICLSKIPKDLSMFVNKSWRNTCIHSEALLQILLNFQKKTLVTEPILPTFKAADMQLFYKRTPSWNLGNFRTDILQQLTEKLLYLTTIF